MPASKKRIQRGAGSVIPTQLVPAALREWVHICHGVEVRPRPPGDDASSEGHRPQPRLSINRTIANSTAIFHSGSRMEKLSYWQQFVRLPSDSLFPRVLTIANPRRRYKDFLYVLLNMRWAMLMTVLMAAFVLNIIAFALVVYACGDPDSLLKAFNLSYQTFSTIGFGIVYPATTCSNMVMVVESFASMLVTSAITGLVFAKFAKPKAKVAFSHVCVIQPYGKKYLALVVRVANATQSKDVTHDVIMEASFKVNLLRIEQKQSDRQWHRGRSTTDTLCSYNLRLLQHNFITFRMGIAVVHVINEDSPLFGMSESDIQGSDMILEVAMSGVDSTLQDTVSERFIYTAEDFRWGYRFAELLDFNENESEVIMDFAKLSAVEAAPIDFARYVRPVVEHPGRRFPSAPTDRTTATAGSSSSQSTTSASSAEELEPSLRAIDELSPDDVPETRLLRERSNSGPGLSLQPTKFSLGMEPLFEPLLQPSVGTQRLHGEPLGADAVTSHLRATRLHSAPAQATAVGGIPPADEAPGDYIVPSQQLKQIQNQLAGDVDIDVNELSSDEEEQEKPSGHQEMFRSRSNGANQSAVSIDVQDTPRFLNILPINIPKSYDFMRLYNSALYVRWTRIIIAFVAAFIVLNLAFGLLYWARMSEVVPYPDINVTAYELAFYMSVHTLATIGYGSVAPSPTAVYMNLLVFLESSLGIIAVTIITGIAWSKFARPRAHIHFSSRIVITHIFGHRCLVFRAANTRHSGDVHENFFRIGVILTNRKTGLRQLYDVPLVTAEWPSIKLPATLIHVIDESSPFYKFESTADITESRVAVIALLTGLDTTFSENVYARKMYFWDDFAYGKRFANFAVLQRDRVEVDFRKFDTLIPENEYEAPGMATPTSPIEEDLSEHTTSSAGCEKPSHV